jgi:hypothetical protein
MKAALPGRSSKSGTSDKSDPSDQSAHPKPRKAPKAGSSLPGGSLDPARSPKATAKRGEGPPCASGTPLQPSVSSLQPSARPARRWRPYQLAADAALKLYGIFILLWRRQSGKTEVLSTWALETMLSRPGDTVILASASLNVGGEVALRAAGVFWAVLERLRARFKALDLGDTPFDFDAMTAAFQAGKLEVRFTHPGGQVSRLKVLAPNPATARGFSGTVFLDEIGFIRDFRELWDAVEPITSSDPTFRLIMCTTPPSDAAHYSHELIVPPAGLEFEATEPAGVWYRSEAGLLVHRVDAWDADSAGAQLYHPETRAPLTTDEHRALALDKEAWDRNYGLRLASTGTSAVALNTLHHAQTRAEAKRCLALEGELPGDWRARLGEISEPVTVGFDVATTEKNSSNPSSITIMEKVGTLYLARLIFRWKTNDPKISRAYLGEIASVLKVRRLCVDASNERFFAKALRDQLSPWCPVELVVSSENITVGMVELPTKTYLGNLLVNALDDAQLALPADRWVRQDFRLVRKVSGRFDTEVDASGNHGDSFDSTKLALHGWVAANVAGEFRRHSSLQPERTARYSRGISQRRNRTVTA